MNTQSAALIMCSILASAVTLEARAQSDTAPPQSKPNSSQDAPAAEEDSLQEVVVTATRRAVDLQRVPATVEAVPASTLKAFNITNEVKLQDLVSGLEIVPAGGNSLFLRGVGSTGDGSAEAQVAVYIDGIYLPVPQMSIFSFNNINQIEILKGPQGTLYGRNATAGLISVTMRDPDATPRLDASLGYANYDTRTENLYASTPITDTLAVNIAVYNSKQSEGWGENVFTGHQVDRSDETGVESKLVWLPTSSTKVTTSFIYDTNNRDYGFNFQELPGTIATDGTTYLGKYRIDSRVDPEAPFTSYIGSVKIQQDLGFADLSSLTAYDSSKIHELFPGNTAQLGEPLPGQGTIIFDFHQQYRIWTQEFQLTSKPSASRLDWVTGLFYYNSNDDIADGTYTTCVGMVCAPGLPPNVNIGRPTDVSYSGYGDANYRVFDATHLTLGLRYTDETAGLTGQEVPLAGFPNSVTSLPSSIVTYPGQPFPGYPSGIPTRLHFDKLTYRVVVAQDFGQDIHGYVSDNLGFKAGEFNQNAFNNPPVEPEVLHAYEAGVKSELFEHKLRLNLAYFYYDYTNVQVRSTAPPALPGNNILENVAAENEKGLDGDFSFVAIKGLTFSGGFEVLDAKFVDFPGTACSSPGPTKMVNAVLVGTVVTIPCDLAGRNVPDASPFSAYLGFIYDIDTAYGRVSLGANDHYDARHSLRLDGSIYAPKANLVDANLIWTAINGRYNVQFWVRNLTDVYTYVAAQDTANGFSVVPGAPRTFGLTVGVHL